MSMRILGIDTSCDDTAISVMEITNSKSQIPNFKILSNVISSQVKLHAKYGGVFPSLAKREHQKNLPVIFKKAVNNPAEVDFVAVTAGPGLEPCLWQGINFAKEMSKKYKKPLISVNHIEAHIIANFVGENSKFEIRNSKFFPAMALVVSGGHTQLILIKKIGQYKLIGETRDDAAGECFDKVARILGLGYPGGPVIAKLAKIVKGPSSIHLPRPMMYTKDYDFSFSGLKTAVLYRVKQGNYDKIEMCHEVQQAVIDVLIRKTIKAAKDFGVRSIILGGGVSANEELRKQFQERIQKEIPNTQYHIPDINLCTDNAAMVAATAYFHRKEKVKDIKADANLRI